MGGSAANSPLEEQADKPPTPDLSPPRARARGGRGELFHSDLSMFQKIGVAGPSSTPLSDLRQTLGARYWPSGM